MRRGRALLAALALPGLAACGDMPAATALWAAPPPAPTVAAVAPAGPVLRVTGGPRPLLFSLIQETGERRLWRAEAGAALATEGPRITAIAGLGPGLSATRLDQPDPLADPRALLATPATTRRSIDLHGGDGQAAGRRFGVTLSCRLSATPEGGWLVVTEACAGDDIAFENRFVAEPATGRIRGSRQWVGDAVLEVEGP
ncbi:YjbF family lipoprotein [Falsiroseomonas tokyonensis]|uniref:YjbF family lipoprotein n=1 Tax=Falsiroseomonas tokyonensis TaxID=430521 RepID=A0ABV7BPI0_9PROT|nr:YjbF family lipoprotein [Falsiroseomonas tokyonensis]MBU8536942.1 YjbF family lipoprotein [Falsiroseomonas tokyonensis]